MEIGGITLARALAEALQPPLQGADVAPDATAALPEAADAAPRAAAAQAVARPQMPLVEPLHEADEALPHALHAGSEFALPADQLVQALLSGLQVEAAVAWPLLQQGVAPASVAVHPHEDEHGRRRPQSDDLDDAAPHDDDAHDDARGHDEAHAPLPEPPAIEDPAEADWCTPLTQALRDALAERMPPRALVIAVEQWQRGRCVVLACPQRDDPASPAWAFVLWPRRPLTATRPPALFGLRVDARLLWSTPPQGRRWSHVRVVKEHHPQRGRQLVAMDGGAAALACEVQLGPVLARSPRDCEVRLRVDAVRRFWSALGAQWSASVVVCSQPLVPPAADDIVEAS